MISDIYNFANICGVNTVHAQKGATKNTNQYTYYRRPATVVLFTPNHTKATLRHGLTILYHRMVSSNTHQRPDVNPKIDHWVDFYL